MNIKMQLSGIKFFKAYGPKNAKALTLVELLVSIMIVGLLIVGFYGFETFTNTQVIDADKRAKVQNQLAYCLEHMSKYISRANGNVSNPPIKLYPSSISPTGFQVRFDCGTLADAQAQTPSDLTNDVWIYYTLSGNDLSVGCQTGLGADCVTSLSCRSDAVPEAEVLSTKIISGFYNGVMPVNPDKGFYVEIDDQGSPLVDQGNLVKIGLVGRYDPTKPVDSGKLVNPQVEAKTKIICNSSSSS
ncbi:MAG: prepilin-type N-terminal cleavage/methylation domain-containing protein [Candidatus Omnitrophota bacterium]